MVNIPELQSWWGGFKPSDILVPNFQARPCSQAYALGLKSYESNGNVLAAENIVKGAADNASHHNSGLAVENTPAIGRRSSGC